jgi:hypothetical protein
MMQRSMCATYPARPRLSALGLALLCAVVSCTGATDAPLDHSSQATGGQLAQVVSPPLAAGLVVSEPLVLASHVESSAGLGVSTASTGGGGTVVSYVSVATGSVPDGVIATIENRRTTLTIATPVVDGGFDPVAIPALVGDTIDVTITRSSGGFKYAFAAVATRKPPRIVRTIPPHGQTDVPVSLKAHVIFSEPIDPTTVTSKSLQLRAGEVPVPATVRVLPESEFTVEVAPNAPLAALTTYTLTIGPPVADLTGDALATTTVVFFVTGVIPPGPTPPPAVSSVWISPQYPRLAPGQVLQLTTVVQDANFNVLSGRVITWSSSNGAIATVSATGVVKGVAPGVAAIFAETGGVVGMIQVTVAVELPLLQRVLDISTVTTGADPDPDGYELAVDGLPARAIGLNQTATLTVTLGQYQGTSTSVWLAGIDPNCSADNDTLRVSTDTARVTFTVTCQARSTLPGGDPLVGVWQVEKNEFFRDAAMTSRYVDLAADGLMATLIVRASDAGLTRWSWSEHYQNEGTSALFGGSAAIDGSVLQTDTDRYGGGHTCTHTTYFDCVSPLIGRFEFVRNGDQLVIRGLEESEIYSQLMVGAPFAWRRFTLRKVR